jgi:cell wall-associated NlpC family hydrolase
LAVTCALLVAPAPATADPTTVAEAQAQLEQYQAEASAAEQAYHDIHDKLVAAQQEVADTETAIADQEAKVADLQDEVVQIALQQYQDQGMSGPAILLTSESTEDLLFQLSTSQRVAESSNATIQQYQVEQGMLEDQKAHLEEVAATIAADDVRLEELKNQAQSKASEAADTLAKLKAAEAAAAAARARAQAAANQAATTTVQTNPPAYTGDGSAASIVVAFGLSKVGGPYVWGGNGPSGYDCSGLTRAAYLEVGISLPHNAAAQAGYGTPVSLDALAPGDLLFYYSPIGHVAIYIGNGQIVHASTYGVGIVVSNAFYTTPSAARRLV